MRARARPHTQARIAAQESNGDYPVADESHRTCIEAVLTRHVYEAVQEETRMGASLLRLHFHDCFVHGCDASILLDEENGEKFSPGNKDSVRGYELVDIMKESITSQCRVQISCADILALAARAGVQAVSPPHRMPIWNVTIGRYDSKYSYANLTGALPGTDEPMDKLMQKFADQSITDVKEFIALIGGGHTIGLNHCGFAKRRLYGNDTTNLYSDPEYITFLEHMCPETQSVQHDAEVSIALDNKTMNIFDNGFFASLHKGRVGIKSDQLLGDPNNPSEIRAAVELFTDNEDAFLEAFSAGMETMGNNGILGSDEGEIRAECRHPNGNYR
ncbi:hypothetical protein GOP47_0025659 [Adiantum capillus-veneris]|uniref:Peroxidase n=1 Tax=Adiantum capillus-veneris TaxID=13818 RepID=A0A9D4U1S9_ADICA|nr:hypothetical protein GOP47_0025659 [Adiantum capillus-veneris]